MFSALHPAKPQPASGHLHSARQRPAFSIASVPNLLVALATALILSCAAAQNNDVSLVLPHGTLLNTLTDTQANAVLATYGYVRPPYAGTVYEIRATEPTQLVRTYLYDSTDPFNPSGRWTMRALNLRGLTPDQIKDFYALPTAVNRATIVQVPTGTRVYAGYAGPLSGWGAGGGPQIFLFDRPPFSNYQPQAALTPDTFYYAPRSGGSNAGQVASYLDRQLPTPFADLETVYLNLDVLNLNAAADPRNALNQLTGEAHTALGAVSGYAAQGVGRTLLERMRGPGSTAPQRTVLASLAAATISDARPAAADPPRQDTWAQLVGTWGRVGDDGGAAGYGYQTRGVLVGRDLGGSTLDWGIAAGYTQSRVGFNRDADRGTVNSLQLAAYGERSRARTRLRGVLGFSYDDYDAERHLPFLGRTATATYRGHNVHGAVELGWPGALAATTVEPFVTAAGVYSRRNGFSEQGAGDASLMADAATQRSLGLGAGVRVSHNMETARGIRVTPRLALGITREVLDRAPGSDVRLAGAAGTFPVTGAAPGREAVSLSASLGVRVRKNVNAYIGYQAQARHNLTEQGLIAGLVASW